MKFDVDSEFISRGAAINYNCIVCILLVTNCNQVDMFAIWSTSSPNISSRYLLDGNELHVQMILQFFFGNMYKAAARVIGITGLGGGTLRYRYG